ncbi:oligosaccharide flippase family protein [Patescibacteria group bacterium]|nr:oligosaccharide flippase family protein [Patescibacteria group bacterium]
MNTTIKHKIYKLLKWSEKYTGTDMVYLAKGGFWSALGQVSMAFASLIIAVAFANLFPEENFGNYQYVLSVTSILAISTLGGINTALVGAVACGFEKTIFPALKTKLKWSTIGITIGLLIAGYYFYSNNFTLGFAFLLAATIIPLRDTLQIYLSFWHGKKKFDTYNKNLIAEQAITAVCLTTAVFFSDNLFIILGAAFLPATFFRLISFTRTANQINKQSTTDQNSINYGKHLSLMGAIGTLAGQIDKILVFHFLGAVPLAIYAFATIPATKVKDIFKIVGQLALPRFSERTMEHIRKEMWKKLLKIEIVAIGAVTLYILIAPIVFEYLFPKYIDSVIYSQIFIIAALFTFPSHILHIALIAKMEKKKLYLYRVGVPAGNIILIAVLLPSYGLWGAVAAYMITKFLELSMLLFLFYRKDHHLSLA